MEIAVKLANALRYQLRYHPEHTVGMCRDALAAYDAAREKHVRDIIASMHTGGTVGIHELQLAIADYGTAKP